MIETIGRGGTISQRIKGNKAPEIIFKCIKSDGRREGVERLRRRGRESCMNEIEWCFIRSVLS